MVVQCCVCKKVRDNDTWKEPVKGSVEVMVASHGYCPTCADVAFREVREYHRHNLHGMRAKVATP